MKRIILLSLILTTVFNCFSQSYNNNAHVFNICMFGAKKATIVFDGVMTSSSATLTSATASFVAGDVGKIIVVKRAGTSGRDLITTIASFTNSTTVTLTASASTSVTIARVTFGIDCTTAIQNAINVANGLLGGKVYVPLGWYIIAGALQTSVGGVNMNSQLYIPFTLNSSSLKDHLIIEGESAPELAPPGGLAADQTAPVMTSGCVFYSTLATGAASAAVIGTGNDGSHSNLNFLSVENMAVIVANSPGGIGPEVGGINFSKGGSLITKRVYVGIDTTAYFSTYPSNNINGIETTNDGAQTYNSIQNTLCVGFRTGYKVGEHTSCDQAQAWVCFYAFQFKSGTHSLEAHRIGTYWCAYDIYVNAASGKCNFINLQFDAEWQQIGKWYDDVNTIKDSANIAKGSIFYVMVAAGVGVDNTKYSISGGSNIDAYPYSTPLASATVRSFTAGSIPFSNGTDLAQSNTKLFWNNSTNGLGIGTSTVSDANGTNALKVVGTANTDIISVSDGTATASMFVNNADANAAVQFGTVSNHSFGLFANNGTPQFILKSTGRITIGSVTDDGTNKLQLTGNLKLETAGNKILITTGTNASAGTGTLSGGTVTISTTAVTASSLIFIQYTGTLTNSGQLTISSKTASTSFVVTSTNASDANTFNWWIIN